MAPVTDHQAIIVSHGSPSDPDGQEAEIARLAAGVARCLPGWIVRGATLAAKGAFETASAQVAGPPLICPLFMAPGWFVDTHLPSRLGAAGACVLPPLGVNRGLPGLVRGEIDAVLADSALAACETTLVVAAHGSPSHPQSSAAVHRFAERLAALVGPKDIRIGFVEEPPFLDQAARVSGPALCLPFFATAGGHVRHDIPQSLSRAGFRGAVLAPLIGYRDLAEFIAGVLTDAAAQRRAA